MESNQTVIDRSKEKFQNMNREKNTMAVTANHFSLYEAFKKEVEKLGWTYDSEFVEFSENTFGRNCMYFSFDFGAMKGQPAFALSNTGQAMYELESEFQQALDQAKDLIQTRSFKLNDYYTAKINVADKTVTVGYEDFSFEKVRELTDLINELELDLFVNKTKKKC